MANWARLQEQLTGLPVVKRSRNSIHFDKGNGEIVANFSGAPCHYEENGEWKPIDTKLLLLPDGFYGSPHSDVKIHKDGRVKAGGYQQKSALVDAKEGVVDGDKIVREFKFGTQYLYMKEDGFRQETVITRPPTTAEAKYLIASESGELPSKYKRSDITAVDADGAVHEFVNLGQFKKWLDAAAYPVTIDPDFSTIPSIDYCILGNGSDYTSARNTAAGLNWTGYNTTGRAATFNTTRSYLKFDTSSIDDEVTISQVNLKLTNQTSYGSQSDNICIAKYNWSSVDPITNSNKETPYDGILLADLDDGIFHSNNMSANTQYTSENLSTTWINKTGYTYYGLISSNDYNNVPVTDNGHSNLYRYNHATESYRPVLTVTYTTGSTGVPKHFLHYARLRSN